ncbi:MAG: hypothetical protein N4A36_01130 [Candidatus Gracilibacteria bacterium]|nr:hypothetical protein [Candidatus Gracilibacteria bacterium]
MKIKIGVMGSAQGPSIEGKTNIEKAEELGKEIAKQNCILVNGACPGLPDDAARGAKGEGGFCMGISPAFSMREHMEKFDSPVESYDIILFTGMGLMERDIVNIRSSDAIITVGGGIGTLNEFTVAFDEGKVVGVLTGTSGISDNIPHIIELCNRELTDNVVFDSDPEILVKKVIDKLKNTKQTIIEDERVVNHEFNPFQG